MEPQPAVPYPERPKLFRCKGHAPHNGAISAGCLVGGQFWGHQPDLFLTLETEESGRVIFFFCGIFPASASCQLQGGSSECFSVYAEGNITYSVCPRGNSEMQRRVKLWAGLFRGSVGPAGSAWCESPAGGRGSRATP